MKVIFSELKHEEKPIVGTFAKGRPYIQKSLWKMCVEELIWGRVRFQSFGISCHQAVPAPSWHFFPKLF